MARAAEKISQSENYHPKMASESLYFYKGGGGGRVGRKDLHHTLLLKVQFWLATFPLNTPADFVTNRQISEDESGNVKPRGPQSVFLTSKS